MRSEVPDGDLGTIIGKAVKALRRRLDARRFAQTKSTRKSPPKKTDPAAVDSRYLLAHVRRFVYRRDGGQCCFVDAQSRRCPERHRLEYHHRHAFGLGGGGRAGNICLMCPTHNRYLAELDYGKEKMARCWRAARSRRCGVGFFARDHEGSHASSDAGTREDADSPDTDPADPPR
jgi:hypothetical protein